MYLPARRSRAPRTALGDPAPAATAQALRSEPPRSAAGGHRLADIAVGAHPSAGGAGGVVQRRVGIEYETQIMAKTPDDEHIPQDERMVSSNAGWHVDSDNSALEFVTEPPVDIGPFANVLTALTATLGALPVPLAQEMAIENFIPGANYTKSYKVQPYRSSLTLTGAPQGTIGIRFDKLFDFLKYLQVRGLQMNSSALSSFQNVAKRKKDAADAAEAAPLGKTPEEIAALKADAAKAATVVTTKKDAPKTGVREKTSEKFDQIRGKVWKVVGEYAQPVPAAELEKLKGMLHLVGQYALAGAKHGSNYKKSSLPVMTRTSFSAMYAALAPAAQLAFVATAPNLITELGLTAQTVAWKDTPTNFPLGTWLDSISTPVDVQVEGEDKTKAIDDPARFGEWITSDLMTMPGAFSGVPGDFSTDKSMGAIPALENGLVVLELRSLKQFGSGAYDVASLRGLLEDLQAFSAFA